MGLSVTEPVGRALERTRLVLFRPFDAGKWFGLGFCAWLAYLVEDAGGGTSGTNYSVDNGWGEGSGESVREAFAQARQWVSEHLVEVLAIGGMLFVLVFGLLALLAWLGSRGRFMFLDGVVRNRGAVKEPWHAFAEPASSLFRFQMLFWLLGISAMLLSLAAGIAIALADIEAKRFGSLALTGIVVGGGAFILVGIGMTLVNMFTRDFVVPAMYARRIEVGPAWSVVRSEILGPHAGSIVLYCLMRIVLLFLIAILVVSAVLATCCVLAIPLAIPYLGTVMLLPFLVFLRSYSLYFIEPLGGPWRLIEEDRPPVAPAPSEGYGSED